MGKILITFDESSKSYVAEEAHKNLNTGYLKHHYRTNGSFIIRESVLYGFRHEFLDSIDVFTSTGKFIAKLYRIRETRYSNEASKDIVRKIINEYLYSKQNREMLPTFIDCLYGMTDNTHFLAIVNNFVENHERH